MKMWISAALSPQRFLRICLVLLIAVVGVPASSLVWHWRLMHANGYPASDLEAAKAYIDTLPSAAAPYRFPGNGLILRLVGDAAAIQSVGSAIEDNRAGYYYRSLNKNSDIEVVISAGLLSALPERRADALRRIDGSEGLGASVIGPRTESSGCATLGRVQSGWLEKGYVLVDTEIAADPRACAVAGFDVLAGFPVKDASFNYLELPAPDVRRLILDFIDDCARHRKSDVDQVNRNSWGVSRPSLACVAQMISEAQIIR